MGVIGYVVFKLIDKTIGLHTSKADQIEGLNILETVPTGYSGIVVDKYSETPTAR